MATKIEAPNAAMAAATKSSMTTGEGIGLLVTAGTGLVGAITGLIPSPWGEITALIATAVLGILRTLIKVGIIKASLPSS